MAPGFPLHLPEDLNGLGVSAEVLTRALDQALVDVRECTDFDAPAMRGFTFWSRTNRYLAEELTPLGWKRTDKDSILRLIHPDLTHAITAISGWGGVGDLRKSVRSKNPKGPALARLVKRNADMTLFTEDELLYGVEVDDLPTWCLLYKREKGEIKAEISLPVEMKGQHVEEWQPRIPIQLPPMEDPGFDISLDDPDDGEGPTVLVEYVGS